MSAATDADELRARASAAVKPRLATAEIPEPPAYLSEGPPDEDAPELTAQRGASEPPAAAEPEQAAPPIVLRHIADIVAERREAHWLKGLHKILERNVTAVLAGARNTFKSFIAHHWAMTAAMHGEPVVILSAEGAGLDRRTDAWMRTYAPKLDLRKLKLRALERAINLNSNSTLEALQEAIGEAPTLILVDTYSKYAPGLDENDNTEVALYLANLGFGLRDFYKSTVLLVAHSGHADAKRPRGASVLMANPDAEYIVTRPDALAMSATLTRERFKDCPHMPPLAYSAEVVDLGRMDSHGEPVTSLVMRDVDFLATLAAGKPELHGKAQRRLLNLLREAKNCGEYIWTLSEIRGIGRDAGMHRNTVSAAAQALTFSPYMVPCVGGWRLAGAQDEEARTARDAPEPRLALDGDLGL
jgi:hypothetical protein